MKYKPIRFIQRWLAYAREFIGETNFIPNKVCVSYDHWFTDKKYRKKISKQLGLKFSDSGLQGISLAGNGSSFNMMRLDGKAQKMDVLNRWRAVEELDNFKAVMANEEVKRIGDIIYNMPRELM
jgi:hypothetical protein